MLSFKLHDGTIYELEDANWIKALTHYLQNDGIDLEKNFPAVEQAFAWLVEQHWQRKTVPTKFEHDESWGVEYATPALLAQDVMYEMIRPALMGLILSQVSGGDLYVVNINEDGSQTKYTDECAARVEGHSKDETRDDF